MIAPVISKEESGQGEKIKQHCLAAELKSVEEKSRGGGEYFSTDGSSAATQAGGGGVEGK